MSTLTAFAYIAERSEATPGLWNLPFSILSANIASVDSTISTLGVGHFQQLSIGSTPPSYATTAAVTIEVNSTQSDYLYMVDSSGARSSYIIGSRAGGTADGLNIWDVSGATMIVSFSKQSIRFYQNVTGAVFDVGGALASTLNAATFGTGADSKESRIQAAISAATTANPAIARVYIPASMYPYSGASIVFATTVQMTREGGNDAVWDTIAYGARVDSVTDDTVAVQAALDGGDIVVCSRGTRSKGTYRIDGTVVINAGKHLHLSPNVDFARGFAVGSSGKTTPIVRLAADKARLTGDVLSRLVSANTAPRGIVMIGPAISGAAGNIQYVGVDHITVEGNSNAGDLGVLLDANASHPIYNGTYRDMEIRNVDDALVLRENANANDISGTRFLAITKRAYSLQTNSADNTISGGFIHTSSGVTCIHLMSGCIYNQFVGISAEPGGTARPFVTDAGASDNLICGSFNVTGSAIDNGTRTMRIQPVLQQIVADQLTGTTVTGTTVNAVSSSASTYNMYRSAGGFNAVNSQFAVADTSYQAQIRLGQRATGGNFGSSIAFLTEGDSASQSLVTRFQIRNDIPTFLNTAALVDGSTTTSAFFFSSETSLGFYRSANSTIAVSYGTFWPQVSLWVSSGISALGSIVSSSYVSSTKTLMGGDFWGSSLSVNVGLNLKAGANKSCGTAVLGSNGSVNVANTYVATGDLIFLTDQTPGGTLGDLEMTGIRNASGFTIASTSVTDTSTVAWLIVRPT